MKYLNNALINVLLVYVVLGKVAFETKQTSGKIFIKSKQNQYKLGIPFTAKVLEGGLKVNECATRFLTTDNRLFPRHLTVENQFKVSIAVNNVSLLRDASSYFQVGLYETKTFLA